jgi:purine-nucleoside phosphorylase
MVITDQINLTGEHITETQRAKPKRSSLYSNVLSLKAFSAAEAVGLTLKAGVYVGMKGPSYETAAEVEMVHRIGGDAVGMSTVLEASLAGALGMEVLGISCITNPGTGISTNKLSHAEVTEVGNRVKSSFALLLTRILEAL